MFHNPRFPAILGIVGAAALLIGGAGCESKPPDEIAKAVYFGERPVAMRGSDTFFGGQVAAIVTISRGIGRGYAQHRPANGGKSYAVATGPNGLDDDPTNTSKNQLNTLPNGMSGQNIGQLPNPNGMNPAGTGIGGGGAPNNGMVPGMGNGGMPGGGMVGPPGPPGQGGPGEGGMGEDLGQGTEQDEDAAKMEQENAIAYLKAKAAIGSPLPPVTLHLHLRNLNGQPVAVEVATFDSDLGNFAVEPGTLNLPPHQLVEPEPMISQLGVTSDVIPVKVTLRLNGQTETKTIFVRSLLDPADGGN